MSSLVWLLLLIMIATTSFGLKWLKSNSLGRSFTTQRLHSEPQEWRADYSRYKSSFSSVTSQQWVELETLAAKLYEWNSKINLVSRKDVNQLVENHILPSLSISKVRRFEKGERIIDVGTGGGLPGLPLAIVNPQATFTLLDSNSKKMMVVEDLVRVLGLESRVTVAKSRAEDHRQTYDFILGRAVKAMPEFLGFSCHLLAPRSSNAHADADTPATSALPSGLLYLKGGDFSEELAAAGVDAASVQSLAVSDLVDGLQSDKSVLFLPAAQITAFRQRLAAQQSTSTAEAKVSPSAKTSDKPRGKSRARPDFK